PPERAAAQPARGGCKQNAGCDRKADSRKQQHLRDKPADNPGKRTQFLVFALRKIPAKRSDDRPDGEDEKPGGYHIGESRRADACITAASHTAAGSGPC